MGLREREPRRGAIAAGVAVHPSKHGDVPEPRRRPSCHPRERRQLDSVLLRGDGVLLAVNACCTDRARSLRLCWYYLEGFPMRTLSVNRAGKTARRVP